MIRSRFCWNCMHEKECQVNGVETDFDYSICNRHRFITERKEKQKTPTRKKNLTKHNKFGIMMSEIIKAVRSLMRK